MASTWLITRFDYRRYVSIRPLVRPARDAAAFHKAAFDSSTEAIARSVEEGALSPADARAAFVQSACCVGQPLTFDGGLPRLVIELGRMDGGDQASEILESVVAGAHNLENWLGAGSGLLGFLKPDEVRLLNDAFALCPSVSNAAFRTGGGVLSHLLGFTRRMVDKRPEWHEMLVPLSEFITDAVQREDGIAVLEV